MKSVANFKQGSKPSGSADFVRSRERRALWTSSTVNCAEKKKADQQVYYGHLEQTKDRTDMQKRHNHSA